MIITPCWQVYFMLLLAISENFQDVAYSARVKEKLISTYVIGRNKT